MNRGLSPACHLSRSPATVADDTGITAGVSPCVATTNSAIDSCPARLNPSNIQPCHRNWRPSWHAGWGISCP